MIIGIYFLVQHAEKKKVALRASMKVAVGDHAHDDRDDGDGRDALESLNPYSSLGTSDSDFESGIGQTHIRPRSKTML